MLGWFKRKPEPPGIRSLTSEQLTAICDRSWYPATGKYAERVSAENELAARGPEIRDWCRRLLVHPDYDAREAGTFFLGQLGARGQLGDAVEAVVAELGALTRRPVEEDCKETQAVGAAIDALAEIGHPAGVLHLRDVLFSEDEFLIGDTQWNAAEALGRLTGQSVMESPDPVDAARSWLSSQQAPGGIPA